MVYTSDGEELEFCSGSFFNDFFKISLTPLT